MHACWDLDLQEKYMHYLIHIECILSWDFYSYHLTLRIKKTKNLKNLKFILLENFTGKFNFPGKIFP
jgi:hypothetical protein